MLDYSQDIGNYFNSTIKDFIHLGNNNPFKNCEEDAYKFVIDNNYVNYQKREILIAKIEKSENQFELFFTQKKITCIKMSNFNKQNIDSIKKMIIEDEIFGFKIIINLCDTDDKFLSLDNNVNIYLSNNSILVYGFNINFQQDIDFQKQIRK